MLFPTKLQLHLLGDKKQRRSVLSLKADKISKSAAAAIQN